eukprot:5347085-Alexandrium_andersonii.AAC.1
MRTDIQTHSTTHRHTDTQTHRRATDTRHKHQHADAQTRRRTDTDRHSRTQTHRRATCRVQCRVTHRHMFTLCVRFPCFEVCDTLRAVGVANCCSYRWSVGGPQDGRKMSARTDAAHRAE